VAIKALRLGPILFLLYVAALQLLIEDCGLRPHHFADDTQIYGFFCSPTPSSRTELRSRISDRIDVASSWLRSHRLQLNNAKTEIIWLTTGRRSHLLPQQPLRGGSDQITPVLVVRDLGIHIDADVSMRSHVMMTTSACFAVLRRLRGIRRSVPRTVFHSLMSCLVLPLLDYCICNTVLAGITLHLALCLQSMMNAAARLVFASSKCDHITPLLRQLHWLKVPYWIDYKLAVLVYLQMSSWPGTVIPRWRTSPSSRVGVSKASAFHFVSWTVCSPYSTRLSNCGDQAFPVTAVRIWNSLPQTHHISVTSCLLLSLEDILLRTLLPAIIVVVPAKWHVNRSCLLILETFYVRWLTVLLTTIVT